MHRSRRRSVPSRRRFRHSVGVRHALALNSGTSGLFLAASALGIGPGDEVIVPGFTYVATLSSVIYARARPVLAEIDETFNLDPADVETRITPRTRAIIAVHMLGNAARVEELRAMADRHGVALIEDTAQAFGASYQGRWLGGFGDAGVYSFNEFKTITCGDGGMLVTDDDDLYARAFAMHDQGHSPFRKGIEVGARPMLGLNLRMTELEGAVLLAQHRKIDQILSHLRANRDLVHLDHRATSQVSASGPCPTRTVTWPRTWWSSFLTPRCVPRDRRARLDLTGELGMACLQPHGTLPRAAHRDRPRLPIRLLVHACRGRPSTEPGCCLPPMPCWNAR